MGAKEFRETQAAWDEVAAGFDEYTTPLTISFAEAALQHVDPVVWPCASLGASGRPEFIDPNG